MNCIVTRGEVCEKGHLKPVLDPALHTGCICVYTSFMVIYNYTHSTTNVYVYIYIVTSGVLVSGDTGWWP